MWFHFANMAITRICLIWVCPYLACAVYSPGIFHKVIHRCGSGLHSGRAGLISTRSVVHPGEDMNSNISPLVFEGISTSSATRWEISPFYSTALSLWTWIRFGSSHLSKSSWSFYFVRNIVIIGFKAKYSWIFGPRISTSRHAFSQTDHGNVWFNYPVD